jgi:hypothetical protein
MKTRTLLLLSVGVGLAILIAGGVLLLQLANESSAVEPAAIGDRVEVGDVDVVVTGVTTHDDGLLDVDVEIGGVDDADGIRSFRLVTGDRPLEPIAAPADGRCAGITETTTTCSISFDVSSAEGSSRVLLLRRGDQQRNWVLTTP